MAQIISDLPERNYLPSQGADFSELKLADTSFNKVSSIDMLLGVQVWAKIIQSRIRRYDSGLTAQDTHLGWIIFGQPLPSSEQGARVMIAVGGPSNQELSDLLRTFWEIQEQDRVISMSADDQWTEENFQRTYYRDSSGRYVVTIPLRSQIQSLGSSRAAALQRFFHLERKLQANSELRAKYVEFMSEYRQLGHMTPVTREHIAEGPVYHIPHHCVTKKFRVVFDASCKTDSGISLNDTQFPGGKCQDDLADIITRFRCFKVPVTADVKKMFRHVRIDEGQWDLQRIFWREHPDDPLQEYWLTVVTYGMTSSGFNAVRAMQQCAIDNQQTYPRACEAIQRNFYVDDMLTGADSEEEAISLGREIAESLGAGGFELDKFMSSSRQVLSELSKKRGNQTERNFPKEYETSILSLSWDSINDEILFKVHHGASELKLTKRAVFSAIAKLYDPNGYLAPVIISVKVLIQDLWRSGVQWDENIPAALMPVWNDFHEQLPHLTLVRVPRWLGCENGANVQLHGFSDASARAYAAVIYLRSTSSNGETRCVIIASKTRVAPLKMITIPKLELCAANLLCRLMAQVVIASELQHVPVTYWSDSMVVLHWISKVPAELKTFVANRVASIQELTESRPWKHIASGDNPADLGSRGIPAVQLVKSNLWWQGPQWLSQSEHHWPITQPSLTAKERLRASAANKLVAVTNRAPKSSQLSINGVSLLERNSTLQSVLRITAYVIKFVRLGTKRRKKTERGLTTAIERKDALEYWAKSAQRAAFTQEIGLIREMRAVDSSSSIHTLRPFLDSNGVLRVYGRLQESTLEYENIHHIILPARSRLTELLLKEAHIRTQHGGVQLCMQYVRQRFWIPSLRRALKSSIARCMKCFRQKQMVAEQLMGNLPRERVRPTRAFKHSGVDYAGPVQTKARAGRSKIIEKGYIAVFVCLVTRAIHLEPVTNQTANAFLAAFQRFTGRRGACSVLWSDNATTFVGADKELRASAEQWISILPVEQISAMGTEWKFIAPGAPHTGDIWEAGVKSMKHHLRRIMGQQIFTFETLANTLVLIEACLNSRPLTALTDDPDDLSALTPVHFLIGEQIVQPLTTDFSEVPQNRLKLWSAISQMQQHFWKRWNKEYINTLQQRFKWNQERENIKVGNLVLIKQDNLPPTLWLLGRISAVHVGKDGLVRSAEVRTEHSTLIRPIQKLCILPMHQRDHDN